MIVNQYAILSMMETDADWLISVIYLNVFSR